ncbi:TPA: hypothetical protein DIS56_00165 [Candidatus Saccharibacteria bacterium]|nr:hypothetical protein [Candidatus Saccharibacteria bacterium]
MLVVVVLAVAEASKVVAAFASFITGGKLVKIKLTIKRKVGKGLKIRFSRDFWGNSLIFAILEFG